MTKPAFFLATAAALAAAAACAAPRDDMNAAQDAATASEKVDPRIGAQTDRICFARSINSWGTIDGDDDAIILREGVNDRYRVEFSGACRAADFRFAQTIGIENRPGGGCVSRGDVLLVEGAGDFVNRCFITSINEWNEDAGDMDGDDADPDE